MKRRIYFISLGNDLYLHECDYKKIAMYRDDYSKGFVYNARFCRDFKWAEMFIDKNEAEAIAKSVNGKVIEFVSVDFDDYDTYDEYLEEKGSKEFYPCIDEYVEKSGGKL